MSAAHHELILGGQKSGKTVRAELLLARWLEAGAHRRALYLATALPWDAEMQQRIARHQQDRARRVPRMQTLQAAERGAALDVPALLRAHAAPDVALVLDCLTLWLTQQLMPLEPERERDAAHVAAATQGLLDAIRAWPGPLYIVSNEIGLGVIPMGQDTRAFVDALGELNQRVAAICSHVTLMVAGLPVTVKSSD